MCTDSERKSGRSSKDRSARYRARGSYHGDLAWLRGQSIAIWTISFVAIIGKYGKKFVPSSGSRYVSPTQTFNQEDVAQVLHEGNLDPDPDRRKLSFFSFVRMFSQNNQFFLSRKYKRRTTNPIKGSLQGT